MKFKINRKGELVIDRAGKVKGQECPHSFSYQDTLGCSDRCPLFGEPMEVEYYSETVIELSLCTKRLHCKKEDFIDERE